MWQLSIGQRFEHSDQLPAGDSFGYYWADSGGVYILAAAGALTAAELEGYRDGPVQLAVGQTAAGLLVFAALFEGWGWSDGCIGHIAENDSAAAAESAGRWASSDRIHGTVTAVLVERAASITSAAGERDGVRLVQQSGGAGDYVAALRYFTMSPEMTRYVGRTLEREYRGPVRSPAAYVQAVTDHQRAYPDCGRWVKERAVWRCRAGD